ncbi:uncharacterized protein [Rhodnius prolixus]|uniref:uncharacterized protein n=1 Tax=Rhodnius prolixus TaxID=13249 RepID=UPI003D188F31
MCSITKEICETILLFYSGCNNYTCLDFSIQSAGSALISLLSEVNLLQIQARISGRYKDLKFFIKTLPTNEFHLELVKKANCFKKEAAFFGTMFSGLRAFLLHKSIPNCYLPDYECLIVLENLTANGYRNSRNTIVGIDLKHAYVSLKALADIHAASLLYEHKIGKKLDEICPVEILRPFFTETEDYPGLKINIAAAKIISRVIDKYCTNYPEIVRERGKHLLFNYCQQMQKSKNYRNVLSHHDLWCANIMFKYDEADEVQSAVIIDFQIYGYSPPSLDVLQLIYCNIDKETRELHMDDMFQYYYNCLSNNISLHKVKPNDLLTFDDFKASMIETMPTALCSASLYMHTVLIPEDEIYPVLTDDEKFQTYLIDDRGIVLEMMAKYDGYKGRIMIAIEDLLSHVANSDAK